MAKTEQGQKSEDEDRKSKNEQDLQLAKELEMSFPASDPPAATQPGSGITGPEAARSEAKADKYRINRRVDRSSAIDRECDGAPSRAAMRNSAETSEGPAPSRLIQEIRPPEAGRVSIIPRPSLR
jgi:hypothetical protein